jgi:hypothetical protein
MSDLTPSLREKRIVCAQVSREAVPARAAIEPVVWTHDSGAIMSSSDRGRNDPPTTARVDATAPVGKPSATAATAGKDTDAYATWLDRMQRARARHAAITKNLYTWSNYKNWADKMKDSWEVDVTPPPGVVAPDKKK